MTFITKEGIILTRICNANILVAPSRLREEFRRAVPINDTAAVIWRLLSEHKSNEEIEEYFSLNYEYPDEMDVKSMINDFEQIMYEKGYLTYEKQTEFIDTD